MILPTKHLRPDRALIAVGSDVLGLLSEPKTVSRLWEEFRELRSRRTGVAPVTYEWFVLAIDLLFVLGAVMFEKGQVRRAAST